MNTQTQKETGEGNAPRKRLEYLRGELRAERISYGEIAELQSLAEHIDKSDVELLEAAGIPEQMTPTRACEIIKAEMDALKREKPNMPKCQMKRLGLRFDWNIVYEALQP